MNSRVFISYNSNDKDEAQDIRQMLLDEGYSVWMAPESIPPGSDYASQIPIAIEECSAFLLVLSESSQNSKWVPKELDMAISYDKTVIPFHIDDSRIKLPFKFRLINIQIIEASDDPETACQRLTDALADPGSPAQEPMNDGGHRRSLTHEEIVALNKARRIETAKLLLAAGALVIISALLSFLINLQVRNSGNHLLVFCLGFEPVPLTTNPFALIAFGCFPALLYWWLYLKGMDIDSPTLKVLSVLLFILTCLFLHYLPNLLFFVIALCVCLFLLISFFR